MKDKRKPKKLDSEKTLEPRIKDGVRHTILAIVFVAITVFLVLASPDVVGRELAGPVGRYAFMSLHYLLGTGYYLLPVLCALVSISFFRSVRPRVVSIRMLGGAIFVLSGLGVIERSFGIGSGRGGIIGYGLALAGDRLVGQASWAIFIALFLISLILIFETSFSIESLRQWREKRSQKNVLTDNSEEGYEEAEELAREAQIEAPVLVGSKVKEFFAKKDAPPPLAAKQEEFVPLVRADQKPYVPPPLDLLGRDSGKPAAGDIKANSNIIKRSLSNFGIEVEMDEVSIGPSITRYALKPAEGVKLSRIVALQNDLSLALAAHPLRVEAPIPGKSLVGIEVPNSVKTTVRLGTLLDDEAYRGSDKPMLLALGKNISGATQFADLAKMPHLLIAGTTGSGKSVTIHAFILALLYRLGPDSLRLLMIDPKRVELTLYNNIPQLLTPVITNPKKAILALKWAAKEMDRRYDILEAESARDIKSYHENVYRPALDEYNKKMDKGMDEETKQKWQNGLPEAMPYIVIIIDELADIMTSYPRELEAAIVRIAQMSRAVGIHLVLSTQRPSTEVITGLIKANVPSRIALQVPSQIDSRTIIDMPGAEKLLGSGDMLYLSGESSKPGRLQSAYVSEAEVKRVVSFITGNNDAPDQAADLEIGTVDTGSNTMFSGGVGDDAGGDDDEMYEQARQTVLESGKASSSLLQRKLKLGYARAARLLDLLEERGVVGPGSGAKPREVYGATGGSGGGSSATDQFGTEFDLLKTRSEAQQQTEEHVESHG